MPPKTSSDLTKPHCYPNLTNISQYRKGWLFAYPRQQKRQGSAGPAQGSDATAGGTTLDTPPPAGMTTTPTTMHGEPGPTPEAPPMKHTNPRRRNGSRRTRLRKRVLAAYDVCWLCGRPVDKTLPPGHPWSGEVDEVIPVSRGGDPLDWSNVRLAHRICNERRGNKSPQAARAAFAGTKNEKTEQTFKSDEV